MICWIPRELLGIAKSVERLRGYELVLGEFGKRCWLH